MWGIKKWPGRILQGALAAGQIANAGAVFLPPLIPIAAVLGLTQVGVAIWQHKSTEKGTPLSKVVIPEEEFGDGPYTYNDSSQSDKRR